LGLNEELSGYLLNEESVTRSSSASPVALCLYASPVVSSY
jgi:hypothetical protein